MRDSGSEPHGNPGGDIIEEGEGVHVAAAVRAAFEDAVAEADIGVVGIPVLDGQKCVFGSSERGHEGITIEEEAEAVGHAPVGHEINEGDDAEVAADLVTFIAHQRNSRAPHLSRNACGKYEGIRIEEGVTVGQAIGIEAVHRIDTRACAEGGVPVSQVA